MSHTEHKILNECEIRRKAKEYGREAARLRKELGYTLRVTAKLVGCSLQTIHGIENGACPSFALREKLNAVLNRGRDLLCK